eukprot:327255_1
MASSSKYQQLISNGQAGTDNYDGNNCKDTSLQPYYSNSDSLSHSNISAANDLSVNKQDDGSQYHSIESYNKNSFTTTQQSQSQSQPQQSTGYQPGEQTQNQYYYYYGGGQPLTDITPTQEMIQNEQIEEKINYSQLSNSLSSPKLIEEDLISEAPTSPALLYNTRNNTYSMPIINIEISTEFHIATAFVSMKIVFQNTSNSKVNTLFILPCAGTVTSTKVNINNGCRFLDTTFIDNDCAQQFQPKQNKNKNKNKNEIQ